MGSVPGRALKTAAGDAGTVELSFSAGAGLGRAPLRTELVLVVEVRGPVSSARTLSLRGCLEAAAATSPGVGTLHRPKLPGGSVQYFERSGEISADRAGNCAHARGPGLAVLGKSHSQQQPHLFFSALSTRHRTCRRCVSGAADPKCASAAARAASYAARSPVRGSKTASSAAA